MKIVNPNGPLITVLRCWELWFVAKKSFENTEENIKEIEDFYK